MSVFKTMGTLICLMLYSITSSADDIELATSELPITLQTLLESSGRSNVIGLVQAGVLNQATLSQTGASNMIDLIQVGNNNQAEVIQLGQDNEVELLQLGADNQAFITQIGDDNLVQINQLGSASFSIEQIADGAAMTITQY